MGIADLRALRETIQEELDALADDLPEPGPLAAKGPMSAGEQARHVQTALQYNALQVRVQVVQHELRRRALGPAMIEEEVAVPDRTRQLAELAWKVMGDPDVTTISAVYREVARRADDDLHLTTVETWLRQENPHHPEETDDSWTELRRAVLLATA